MEGFARHLAVVGHTDAPAGAMALALAMLDLPADAHEALASVLRDRLDDPEAIDERLLRAAALLDDPVLLDQVAVLLDAEDDGLRMAAAVALAAAGDHRGADELTDAVIVTDGAEPVWRLLAQLEDVSAPPDAPSTLPAADRDAALWRAVQRRVPATRSCSSTSSSGTTLWMRRPSSTNRPASTVTPRSCARDWIPRRRCQRRPRGPGGVR